jgi:hypothetical protein
MDDMPKRVEMLYQDARANLGFIKHQQWRVTSYALTAYAALYTLAVAIKATEAEKCVIFLAILLVAAFTVAVLLSFRAGLKKFRDRIAWVYTNTFTS